MVAPALDRNPRRMKQFLNLFRFQRTIGLKTGLFSYKKGTNPNQMWNCKKLAKFVAISINWPSIISALNSNTKLLEELQEYALKSEEENNETEEENKKIREEYKNLERWVKDEKLIRLLREGCEESDNTSYNLKAEYSLSNLDFSKLLQISPITMPIISFNNLVGEELMKRLVSERNNLVKADLKGTKLKGVDLERANLEQADLTQVDLEQADLEFANLTQTYLSQANLKEAKFKGADLTGANLEQAKLMQAELMQAKLIQADLIQANLTEAILMETDFRGANLTQANLTGANLKGSNLTGADLTGANLTGANLYRADLQETELIQANFESANLTGAYNLTIYQLSKVKTLYNAELDKELERSLRDEYPELFEKRK